MKYLYNKIKSWNKKEKATAIMIGAGLLLFMFLTS